MKQFTFMRILLLIIFVMFISAPALAGTPYMSLKGSIGKTNMGEVRVSHISEGLVNATDNESSTSGFSPGLAIGYDLGAVRIEFEYFNRAIVEHNTGLAFGSGGYVDDGVYVPIGGPVDMVDVLGLFSRNDITSFNIKSKVDTETFFLNAYMESDTIFGYTLLDNLEFYLGAGVGMAKHKSKINYGVGWSEYTYVPTVYEGPEPIRTNHTSSFSDRDSNSSVAFNLQLGASYLIIPDLAVDVGLRYADLGEVKLGLLEADKIISKEIVCSVRYLF